MNREEFDLLPASELQQLVKDPVLVRFIFEERSYRADELVAIVRRIKQLGEVSEGGGYGVD